MRTKTKIITYALWATSIFASMLVLSSLFLILGV